VVLALSARRQAALNAFGLAQRSYARPARANGWSSSAQQGRRPDRGAAPGISR
jgi:hypothetical protein